MLLGQVRSTLDGEQALVLPDAFRAAFPDGAYITRGFDRDLMILSDQAFQELVRKAAALNITDPLARMLMRLILGNASHLEFASTGRFVVPPDLLAAAGLTREVILVGQGDYCELWSPEEWEHQTISLLDGAANAARFAQLNLALN